MTMDKIVPTAAATIHYVGQNITTTASAYAYSVYAKASGYNYLQLWCAGTISAGYVNFDLSTGTVS